MLNSCSHIEDGPKVFVVCFFSALISVDCGSCLWITSFFRFSKSFDGILLRPRLLVYVLCDGHLVFGLLTYLSYPAKTMMFHVFMWPPKRQKSLRS